MENTVQLQNTTVGPILGHITTTTARIFLRGGDQLKKDNSVRIAAVRYRDSRNTLWKVHTKTIQRENDNTVVIQLSGLSSNKNYTFQIGWCNASNEFLADPDATESFIWPQKKFKFRTQSDTSNLKRSYLIGSCRYLNITAGIPISAGQSSSIFRAMARQKIKTDALVMVGDQIYADDMNALGQDTSLNDFLLKYRAAFSEKEHSKTHGKDTHLHDPG